eukprot:Sspe_Gene.46624::Locus_23333_Transcript_1_1_Confidence_1.000_Length_905::g.46624::m.46624
MFARNLALLRYARFVHVKSPTFLSEKGTLCPRSLPAWRNRDCKAVATGDTACTANFMVAALACAFSLEDSDVRVYDMSGEGPLEEIQPDGLYYVTGRECVMKTSHIPRNTDPEQSTALPVHKGLDEYNDMWGKIVRRELDKRQGADCGKLQQLVHAFEMFDLNNDMKLTRDELQNALQALEVPATYLEVSNMFAKMDVNRDDELTLDEWLDNIPSDMQAAILKALLSKEVRQQKEEVAAAATV